MAQQQIIYAQQDGHDDSTAARCLGLIERNARKFMGSAGFGLPREIKAKPGKKSGAKTITAACAGLGGTLGENEPETTGARAQSI